MSSKNYTEHLHPQLSEEWFRVRLGKVTGSRFKELMANGRGKDTPGESFYSLVKEKACEILTGQSEDHYQSKAMELGNQYESEAVDCFSFETGLDVRECGFFEISKYAGASPDRIILSGGVLEVKCPLSKTHFSYYLDRSTLVSAYNWQIQGEMLAANQPLGYLVSYDPRMPISHSLVVVDVPRDELMIEQLLERISLASELIKEWTA